MICRKCAGDLPDGVPFCCWCGSSQLLQKKGGVKKRGNGQGSVYKRGKTWQIELTLGKDAAGARIRKFKGGFSTKKEAMEYMAEFISYGESEGHPGPKLIDWEQDAQLIIGDVNKVAGREVRETKYLHWWTFLSYFYGIGEGQLSTIVSIRSKKSSGRKLEMHIALCYILYVYEQLRCIRNL